MRFRSILQADFKKIFCPSAVSQDTLRENIIPTGSLRRSGLTWEVHAWNEYYLTSLFQHVSNLQNGNIEGLNFLDESSKGSLSNNSFKKIYFKLILFIVVEQDSLAKNQCASIRNQKRIFLHFFWTSSTRQVKLQIVPDKAVMLASRLW